MKNKGLNALAASLLVPVSGIAMANSSHEINLGIADIRDINDRFIGVQYRHYLDPVQDNPGPYLINPYLQRRDSVSVEYFNVSGDYLAGVGGNWFIGDKWLIDADITYIRSDNISGRTEDIGVDVSAGYFINPDWLVGTSVLYAYQRDRNGFGFSESENETFVGAFTRYTKVKGGTGWDLQAQYFFEDEAVLQASARYFFSQAVSLGSTYTYFEDDDDYFYDDDEHIVELDIDYWFSPNSSVRFGLGTRVGSDDNGLASLTLLGTWRF